MRDTVGRNEARKPTFAKHLSKYFAASFIILSEKVALAVSDFELTAAGVFTLILAGSSSLLGISITSPYGTNFRR